MKEKRHQPYHLYLDDHIYFISTHIYDNQPILRLASRKAELKKKLDDEIAKKGSQIIAWVILDNHYHLLIKVKKGEYLQKIFGFTHGSTSYKWNREDNQKGRTVWKNYWDHCIRDERDYWKHFNYIYHNPVKHNYVEYMENYEFSSFKDYVELNGYEWIMSAFEQHPIIDYSVEHDDDFESKKE